MRSTAAPLSTSLAASLSNPLPSPLPSPQRVADYLMLRLAQAGAGEVFFLPGGGAMFLNDALACQPALTPVACHHEQACGIAAEAWGRVRGPGHFGTALVTTGPGATNIITPVAGAWIESVPLLIISGQVKRADRLAGRPLRQGGVQEVDIIPMVKSVTKYAATVETPEAIVTHLDAALRAMQSGRCGPVWLDIPLDVQAAPFNPAWDRPDRADAPLPATDADTDAGAVSADCLDDIAQQIAKARRPLLLVGHGVRLAGATAAVRALAERLAIPIATTWNALDTLPWDHPLAAGRPGVVALRGANFAIQNCDLLLSIGCRLDPIVTAYAPRNFARAAQKIIVDVDPHELGKLDLEARHLVACDAAAFISRLELRTAHQAACNSGDWLQRIAGWKTRYPARDQGPASGAISHYRCIAALSAAIPEDTLISTGSSGLAIEVFYTVFRNRPGQRVFLTSGLGSMGYGLPAAIGACLANGKQPMVAIESDGSLQLNLQELATLCGKQLPIALVILNNNGYSSIRNTQRNYFASRHLGTGPEAGLLLPDLGRIAAAYELPYTRIDEAGELPGQLASALNDCFTGRRPLIIDIHLTPDETLEPKVAAIPQADGRMLSMPLEDMSPLLPLEELAEQLHYPPDEASARARTSI